MATQTAGRGLSTDDLARIRDTLATGRKPKVMFTDAAGQIAGQVGQVVELTDPAASDEWVVVRFGNDELPFSPADLVVPKRAAAAAKVTSRRASTAPLPSPREESAARATAPPPPGGDGASGPAPAAKAAPPAKAAANAKAEPPAKVDGPAKAEEPPGAEQKAERKPARKAAKPKAPASLTVTLTYADGEWMVGATQGSRALAKPYVIKPTEALKMVSMLDVPGVHEAVDEIVSAARAEAERQAERLRAELAEVESKLAELRGAP